MSSSRRQMKKKMPVVEAAPDRFSSGSSLLALLEARAALSKRKSALVPNPIYIGPRSIKKKFLATTSTSICTMATSIHTEFHVINIGKFMYIVIGLKLLRPPR